MNYLVTNIWKYWKFGNNWKFGNSGGSWIGGFFLKNTTTLNYSSQVQFQV